MTTAGRDRDSTGRVQVPLGAVIRTMRPHQWVKNLFVVAPLIFAQHASHLEEVVRVAVALVAFCGLSGSVYLLNDIVDAERDRQHPVNRHRPIASGELAPTMAWTALALVLLGSLAVGLWVSPVFAVIGLGYFGLNVAYSTWLKYVVFIDVLCIASGFILRLLGGAVAAGVPLSVWLILCTFLLALYLGLGKRKHELVLASRAESARRVLASYRPDRVRVGMLWLSGATATSYAAYVFLGVTDAPFSPRELVWTFPFVGFGLWRFYRLTERAEEHQSPTDLMLTDRPFVLNLLAWGAVVIAVVYLS